MNFLRANSLSLILLIVIAGISIVFYPHLPETLPTKFDLDGNPKQIASKDFVALFMPCIYLVLILAGHFLTHSSPNKQKNVKLLTFALGLLFTSIHLGMVLNPGDRVTFPRFLLIGVALFIGALVLMKRRFRHFSDH